jgi:hypothetical protein
VEDGDHDIDTDLVFHFNTQDLNLDEKGSDATVTGKTSGVLDIEGKDSINTLPKAA